jgi:hypothetical protein
MFHFTRASVQLYTIPYSYAAKRRRTPPESLDINITSRPFCQRMFCVYLTTKQFPLLFTTIYPCNPTNNICSKYLNRGYRVVHGRGNNQILILEVASSFLWVFNMSATMARQGGWVQLDQSDMCLA